MSRVAHVWYTHMAKVCVRCALVMRAAFILALGSLASGAVASAQKAMAREAKPLPTDPAVRTGTLPNGLRYFVRRNTTPAGRAELQLVVNAGSVQEDDDQRGFAHFLEHMAFNGTRRFGKQRLINYIESVGMTFGAHLNAYTSFEETVYQMTMPTEPAILDTAFMILEDWAQAITLDSAEIEAERGVIMEERRARGGTGSSHRVFEIHAKALLPGTRYAERLPIGTPEVIEKGTRAALVRYYKDWYRPDLMTVIAVGDFDPNIIEARIRARFGAMPRRVNPRPFPSSRVQLREAPTVSIAKAGQSWDAQLYFPIARFDSVMTEPVLRQRLQDQIFYFVLSERLGALARAQRPVISGVQVNRSTLGRLVPAHVIALQTSPATFELGIIAVRAEITRIARDGITSSEMTRARTRLTEVATSLGFAQQKASSRALANEYVQAVLVAKPVVDLAVYAETSRRLAAGLTVADIQAVAAGIEATLAPIILATVPSRGTFAPPERTALLEALKAGAQRKLPKYRDTALVTPLLASPPARGAIVRERTVASLDVTEWTLSNGAKVLVRPSNARADNIVIYAVGSGGLSQASDADYPSAMAVPQIVRQSGISEYSPAALDTRIGGIVTQWQIDIAANAEQIVVGGSPRYAKTLAELLYLSFTAPRVDSVQFKKWRDSQRRGSPGALEFALLKATTQRHPRVRPLVGALVDSIDVATAIRFYRERFGNAGRFTFVIVGDVVPDSIRGLVEQYIGALPGRPAPVAGDSSRRARDWGIRAPSNVVTRTVTGGDSSSTTRLVFDVPLEYTASRRAEVQAIGVVLGRRLRMRLREELSGTYSVGVSGSATQIPYAHANIQIGFSSDPDRMAELQRAMFAVVDTLRAQGVTEEEARLVRETLRRRHEARSQESEYWIELLAEAAEQGQSLDVVAVQTQKLASVTRESLNAVIAQLLDPHRYVLVTSLPLRLAPSQRDGLLVNTW